MPDDIPRLHICVTCAETADDTPGQDLFDRVQALMGDDAPFTLEPVKCLAACEKLCTATISHPGAAPGKWRYLLGGLTPDHAADLIVYGAAYAQSQSGVVLPSRRPESLRHAILGRIPA